MQWTASRRQELEDGDEVREGEEVEVAIGRVRPEIDSAFEIPKVVDQVLSTGSGWFSRKHTGWSNTRSGVYGRWGQSTVDRETLFGGRAPSSSDLSRHQKYGGCNGRSTVRLHSRPISRPGEHTYIYCTIT